MTDICLLDIVCGDPLGVYLVAVMGSFLFAGASIVALGLLIALIRKLF